MADGELGPDWQQFVDEESGCPYHYNSATGESRWADGDEFTPPPEPPNGALQPPARDELDEESAEEADEERGGDSDGSDDALLPAAQPGPAAPAPPQEPLTPDEVEERTSRVLTVYGWLFLFHGCCCEGPGALLEALLRAPACLVVGLALLAVGRAARARLWLREAALFLAAALSLLVPCLAAVVYLDFSPDDAWYLRPLPTLLGAVDPRRFLIFCMGQAGWAANARYESGDSLDGGEGEVLVPLNWVLAMTPTEEQELRMLSRRVAGVAVSTSDPAAVEVEMTSVHI